MSINTWTVKDERKEITTLKVVYASNPHQAMGKCAQRDRRGRGHRVGVLDDNADIQTARLQSAPHPQEKRTLDSFIDLPDESYDVGDPGRRRSDDVGDPGRRRSDDVGDPGGSKSEMSNSMCKPEHVSFQST